MGRIRTSNLDLDLPKRVYLERGVYWYRDKDTGTRIRLGRTKESMEAAYRKLVAHDVRPIAHLDEWAKRLLSNVKKNAKARAIPVDLTLEDVKDLLLACGGRCTLSGIRFSWAGSANGANRHPWIPSLDRIDSQKHYFRDNCRVVCVAVNYALNEFGEDVLLQIAAGMIRKLASTANAIQREESILRAPQYPASPPEEPGVTR